MVCIEILYNFSFNLTPPHPPHLAPLGAIGRIWRRGSAGLLRALVCTAVLQHLALGRAEGGEIKDRHLLQIGREPRDKREKEEGEGGGRREN